MKKKVLYMCMCIIPYVCFSQQSQDDIYKIYKRHITGCRSDVEEIILYNDNTFLVSSCIGGIGIQYRGGWWINDSLLILQPSQNCKGPILLYKEEYQDKKTKAARIEVYNEKGNLIHYSTTDSTCRNRVIFENGCHLIDIKENFIHRYFHFAVKGKCLTPIPIKKSNNVIEMIILEPSTSSEVYMGKQTFPLKSLTESSLTTGENDN